MIKEDIKSIKSSKKDLRNFGLIIGTIFIVLGLYWLWRGRSLWEIFVAIGGILVLAGIFVPAALKWFYRVWMSVGVVLGLFVTNILLSVFFYVLLTPLSLIARLAGKKFMDLGFRNGRETYWQQRPRGAYDTRNLERQF